MHAQQIGKACAMHAHEDVGGVNQSECLPERHPEVCRHHLHIVPLPDGRMVHSHVHLGSLQTLGHGMRLEHVCAVPAAEETDTDIPVRTCSGCIKLSGAAQVPTSPLLARTQAKRADRNGVNATQCHRHSCLMKATISPSLHTPRPRPGLRDASVTRGCGPPERHRLPAHATRHQALPRKYRSRRWHGERRMR